MATYRFSLLAPNAVLDFDPAVDRLLVDDPALGAAEFELRLGADPGDLVLRAPTGATVQLLGTSAFELDAGRALVFADGSVVALPSIANGFASQLSGTARGDLMVGSPAAFAPRAATSNPLGAIGAGGVTALASLSADGRYVLFATADDRLDGGRDDNPAEVGYLVRKDLWTGEVIYLQGRIRGDANDPVGALSADGSEAAIVGGVAREQLLRWSSDSPLVVGLDITNYASRVAAISGDGRVIWAWDGDNSLLAYGGYAADTGSVVLVDARLATEPSLNHDASAAAIDLLQSKSAADTNSVYDIYVYRSAGLWTWISRPTDGSQPDGNSVDPSMSADGRTVAFSSYAGNLVPEDVGGHIDIFVWRDGVGLQRASVSTAGVEADGDSAGAAVSGDGRYVVFYSLATNLVAGDTNGVADVFVRDLVNGQTVRVSVSASGVQGNGASVLPTISADGSTIAFQTTASNLLPGDGNGQGDIVVVSNPLYGRTLQGGAGNDTYLVANPRDRIVEASGGGTDTVKATISYTLPNQVENLQLAGQADIAGTGNSADNVITGNAGNNRIDGGAGTDTVSYATAGDGVSVALDSPGEAQETGSAGIDTLLNVENLSGSPFDDVLMGSDGGNVLDGGAGADLLVGGAGNDAYVVDRVDDLLLEEAGGGTDTVRSRVSWTLGDHLENLVLLGGRNLGATGNALANTLTGNGGANRLDGGGGIDTASYAGAAVGVVVGLDLAGPQNTRSGVDTLVAIENLLGSAFNDTLHGNAGSNVLNGGAGTDTASYARAAAAVTVNLAIAGAQATGGAGSDTLVAIENLLGSAFADRLTGNSGANRLDGGAGNDTLAGGAGADVFRFATAPNGTTNADLVSDFVAADDAIQLENAVFAKLVATGALAASHFLASASGTAADADDYLLYETDTGQLRYDADGSGPGAAVLIATFTGAPALTAGDLFVT